MNTNTKQQRMNSYIQLAQEWYASGLTQAEFARQKGLTVRTLSYRICKARNSAPDMFTDTTFNGVELAAVPKEYLDPSSRMYDVGEMTDQPSLMIQAGAGCLQATNQIDPYLLKVAMEVLLSC